MEDRGLFKLPARPANDPVVHYRLVLEDDKYVAYIWTDDRTLDKVARATDSSARSYRLMNVEIRRLASQWLLANETPPLAGA